MPLYKEGALEIKCLNKDGGFSIVFKGTKKVVPGTKEYDNMEDARTRLEELENGDD